MVQFPSSPFVSFIRYSPKGTSDLSVRSREICYAIKRDGLITVPNAAGDGTELVRAIDRTVFRLESLLDQFPVLLNALGRETTLIPIPRSAPVKPGTLWPAERICRALHSRGLAADVIPCLNRIKAVPRSAGAGPGERATPEMHYDSFRIVTPPTLIAPRLITLVDDVVTRGSTFLGAIPHVADAFPGVPIQCFAVVRTESYRELETLIDPVEGLLSMRYGQPHREP